MPAATFIRCGGGSGGGSARKRAPERPRIGPEKPADESVPVQEMV